jgi:hypothetical protein
MSDRALVIDAIAAVCLVGLSMTVAYRYVNQHFALAYDSAYRDCTEDLLYPCVGRPGFTIDAAALDASPHWQAFVARRIDALSCDALRDLPRVSAGHLSAIQRYLHASLGALFAIGGPRRSVYIVYMTAMVGLTVLAAYGLFRLGVGPLTASLATLPLIFSDLHLSNALHPAEYVKAPFFLACLFFVGLIVARSLDRRRAFASAAAAGIAAGLGIGFKTDVLICIPIAVIAIAMFAPRSIDLRQRAAAVAVFLGAVALAGWPILKAQFLGSEGSLFPVQVLGGMNWAFDDTYAQPALYDYGVRFDDTHIVYLINSYDQRVNGAVAYAEFYSKQLQNAATQVVVDLDRTFPSDFLLRAFAAPVRVLKLGRFGVVAALVVLPALFLIDVRLGGCVAFLLCTAVGYTSLVLQPKHFFHLEWVPWWFTAVAVEQVIRLAPALRGSAPSTVVDDGRRWMAGRARRVVALVVMVLAALTVFLIARQLQQARVVAIVADSLRHAADQQLATAATVAEDGSNRLTVAGLGGSPRSTPLVEDYLVFDVECSALEDAEIVGVYEQATSPRERMTVPCSRDSRRWKLFWPVYQHAPASRLRWFETTSNAGIQIHSIHRVADLRGHRLLLKLAVPGNYEQRQWYHTLRRGFFGNPLGTSQGT